MATLEGWLQLNTAATAKAKDAYVANGLAGESCSAGGVLTPTERGHGYNVGNCNSPQQTASGTWIQIVGGATLNDPSVQGYLEWQRNRYRYTNISPTDARLAVVLVLPVEFVQGLLLHRGFRRDADTSHEPHPGQDRHSAARRCAGLCRS
jgi:hypothetical protein